MIGLFCPNFLLGVITRGCGVPVCDGLHEAGEEESLQLPKLLFNLSSRFFCELGEYVRHDYRTFLSLSAV